MSNPLPSSEGGGAPLRARGLLHMQSEVAAANIPPSTFRWKSRVLLPVSIVVLFALLLGGSAHEALTPATEVRATPVIQRPGSNPHAAHGRNETAGGAVVAQAAGWIEPSPYPIYVSALTDGVVAEVLVLEGEPVSKGQPLARLVNEDAALDLRRAEAMLRERKGALAAAKAELEAADTTWRENVGLRREAAVASASVRETSASLALARQELRRERAMLEDAEFTWERQEALRGSNTISESELVAAKAMVEGRRAAVQGAGNSIEMLEAQLDRMRAEESAAARDLELRTEDRLRLDAARAQVESAEAAYELAAAERDIAALRLARLEIVAPGDGVVMQRLVEPGSKVMIGMDDPHSAHIIHMYDPAHMQVRVDVPLADAAKLAVGQQADVVVEVLPDRTFTGRVARVTNFANIQKNTLEVKVVLDETAPQLKPDMLARVRFRQAPRGGDIVAAATPFAVFAPQEAIEGDGDTRHAWVVTAFDGERGTASRRNVSIANEASDGWVEIADGLRPGDLVITASDGNLNEGLHVRIAREEE